MEENIQDITINGYNREAIGFTDHTKELVIPEFFVGNGKNDTVEGQTYQVTKIGCGAFADCINLEKVVLPDSVVKIQSCAFADDVHLKDIRLSKNLQEIEKYAFCGTKLQKIHLPERLEIIDDGAFAHCKYLETVDTSKAEKLKTIGQFALDCCPKLKAFSIPKNIIYLAENAFLNNSLCRMDSESSAYKSIQDGQLLIDTKQSSVVWASTQSKNLVLPPEINEIDFCVFPWKTYVFIPKTVQKIALDSVMLSNGATIIIDKPKDSIPNAPWGIKNAHIYWIG